MIANQGNKPVKLPASAWLTSLRQSASHAQLTHLHLLVDAAGLGFPLKQRLDAMSCPPDQVFLFEGTPEAALAKQGPILLRVDLENTDQQNWLEELLQTVHGEHRVIALLSDWPLEALGKHLRHFTQAGWSNGKRNGVLRYYDPRVFQGMAHNLDAQQCYQFHAAVQSWHWIDREGEPQRLSGLPQPGSLAVKPLPAMALTIAQLTGMRLWNRADALRSEQQVQPATFRLDSQQKLHEHLMRALQAADAQGCPEDHEWALGWLADDLNIATATRAGKS